MLWDTNYGDAELYVQVVPEIQNVHSVFQRVFKVGYSQDITRLIHATSYLTSWSIYIRYLSQDTIQLALESSVNFPIPHAECLISLGHLYNTEGQHIKAETCFREAAVLFTQAKDMDGEAEALQCSGNMLFYLGQLDQSEFAFKTSLKLYTKTGNKAGQAQVRQGLGDLYRHQDRDSEATFNSEQISNIVQRLVQVRADLYLGLGDLAEAEKYATEASNIAKRANYAIGEGEALQTLGNIYLALDRVPEARQALEQSLMISKQQNAPISQLNVINDLADVYIQSDQLSAAEALLTASSKVELDVDHVAITLTKLGWLYICGDRLDKAEPVLDDALQRFRRFNYKSLQAVVLGHLGTVYLKTNRLDKAERVLKSIPDLGIWNEVEIPRLWVLGDLYIVKGELEHAQTSFNAAMAACKNGGEHPFSYHQGNILRSMGTLHVKQNHINLAIDAFMEAHKFHRKAQWVSEQATDLKKIGEVYEMFEMAEEAEDAFREAEELTESIREARILKE
jgi:tetratricopeptide (TPR) repeat protein